MCQPVEVFFRVGVNVDQRQAIGSRQAWNRFQSVINGPVETPVNMSWQRLAKAG